MKLDAKHLRKLEGDEVKEVSQKIVRQPIYLILEDIYDTYNVGGLFRLADAAAVKKVYLCGETETPPNHKVKKASIGTYKVVEWEYRESSLEVIKELRNKGVKVVAIEQDKRAINYAKFRYEFPLALLVGNESHGVKKETLNLVDSIVEIPMYGINKSLNVIVAASIVVYRALSFKK